MRLVAMGYRGSACFAALALLSACATPEQRLRAGLTDAGLPASLSACMARDMTPRLSVTQLLRLRALSRAKAGSDLDRYLHQVRALGDGAIWGVTSRAALRCTTGL